MPLPATLFQLVISLSPQQATQPLPEAPAPQAQAPKPNPDANGVYHFEKGVVSIPELVYSVQAELPEKARKHRLSGSTRVRIVCRHRWTRTRC